MASKEKVWQEVKNDLVRRITGREFKLHAKFFSLSELSSEYSISDITSRRVIRELSRLGYIESIPGKGSFVKSRISETTIVLLSSNRSIPLDNFYTPNVRSELYKGMLMECGRRNSDLIVLSPEYANQWPKEKPLYVVVIGSEMILEQAPIKKLFARKNCMRVFCHANDHVKNETAVRIPYKKAMKLGVEHLIERGHRRIAYLSSSFKSPSMTPRFEGYYESLSKHNIALDFNYVRELQAPDLQKDGQAVDELMALPEPPTAIVTVNNTRAFNVLKHCKEKKIRVPEDLALVAFDNIPECSLISPHLTVINTFWEKIGAESIRLLLEMAETGTRDFDDIIVEPELIIRETT